MIYEREGSHSYVTDILALGKKVQKFVGGFNATVNMKKASTITIFFPVKTVVDIYRKN